MACAATRLGDVRVRTPHAFSADALLHEAVDNAVIWREPRLSWYRGRMLRTVLWQVKAEGQPLIRCVLEPQSEGRYSLHLLKARQTLPVMVHDYADRVAAIQGSITLYRVFKDKGQGQRVRGRSQVAHRAARCR
jgi:hypothetical protein